MQLSVDAGLQGDGSLRMRIIMFPSCAPAGTGIHLPAANSLAGSLRDSET